MWWLTDISHLKTCSGTNFSKVKTDQWLDGWFLGNTRCCMFGCVGALIDNGTELILEEPVSICSQVHNIDLHGNTHGERYKFITFPSNDGLIRKTRIIKAVLLAKHYYNPNINYCFYITCNASINSKEKITESVNIWFACQPWRKKLKLMRS